MAQTLSRALYAYCKRVEWVEKVTYINNALQDIHTPLQHKPHNATHAAFSRNPRHNRHFYAAFFSARVLVICATRGARVSSYPREAALKRSK
jgi:hypothetical protein